MTTKKLCTLGPRHSWTFVKNTVGVQRNLEGTQVRISKRGIYRCACGETKIGAPGHE